MRPTSAAALVLALASVESVSAAAYSLTKSYEGTTFFDDWTFYGNYDNLTNGDAIFVNQSASATLAYVNSAGNAIIKVDNTSVVAYNDKRNTVRITTAATYGIGSLYVLDAVHVPYGCSVWPSFWSQAPNWPSGGEIDMFEGVNLMTANQMALHTETGCEAVGTSSTETGTLTYANCSSVANGNSGCTVVDSHTDSYGAAFAAAGGGLWATELSTEGVSIWFFSRANIPSDLLTSNTSAVPDPTGWGTPSAYYANSGCAIDTFFVAQHLTIDITLCGDWAGSATVFNETCSGVCYTDYVLNASSYADAYFEIPSVRVYSTGTNSSSNSSSSTSSKSAASALAPLAGREGAVVAFGAVLLAGAMALL